MVEFYGFLVGGFNPSEKYWSNSESSLNMGKNKKCFHVGAYTVRPVNPNRTLTFLTKQKGYFKGGRSAPKWKSKGSNFQENMFDCRGGKLLIFGGICFVGLINSQECCFFSKMCSQVELFLNGQRSRVFLWCCFSGFAENRVLYFEYTVVST